MNNQNIVTIVEYEELLEKLLPMRIFHKRIIGILLYHWFLAGVFDAEQQLAQLKDEEFFLYLLPGLTIVILGVMIILYDRIGRYKINVVVGGLIMCSVILRVITLEIDSRRGFVVGELLIGCLPRAMCGNLLFLIL